MPDFLTDQALSLKNYLVQSTRSLESSTHNIDDFVRQTNSMKEISKKLPKIKERIGFVGQAFTILELLKGHVGKLPKDASKEWKTTVTGLLQAQNVLDAAMYSAEEGSERNHDRFAKDVAQILIPNLNKEITKVDTLVQEKKYLQADTPMETAIK